MSAPSSALAPADASVPKAALWMGGWLLLMLLIAIAGREAARELTVFQIMEMRSLIGLVLIYPLLRRAGGWPALRTRRPWLHVARNVVHYAAQYGWFAALTLIPLAQVVSIEFTMPIWSALLAVAFLGERMNPWKTLAIALGILGVGLIVRPASTGLSAGQAIALAASVGFAVSVIMVKSLTRSDHVVAIIFWMLVVQSLLGLLPAALAWRWPSATVWGWIGVVAFCGTFSHYCMARAMRHADATVVVPMDFVRVPLTAMAGWLVYAERIDLLTVVGVVLILTGNLLNLRRPRRAIAA
jgi:drug/metabolite transporter (DMT)-like permease